MRNDDDTNKPALSSVPVLWETAGTTCYDYAPVFSELTKLSLLKLPACLREVHTCRLRTWSISNRRWTRSSLTLSEETDGL